MNDKRARRTFKAVCLGGGLSGLAASYLLEEEARKAGLPLELTVLEGEERLGGKIGTMAREGYRCEIGPNGFLDNKPFTLDLCRQMGVSERLLRSNDSSRKRYIYSRGKLNRLPESQSAFLRSDLISLGGKLRIAAEYFVPRKKDSGDETLADFVRRRLGREALETLIDPMASGIFAGDPENMSLAACFPKIVALEENYGGLIRGMLALKKEASREGKKRTAAAGPGGVLMSFRLGLEELIEALSSRLEGTVMTASPASALVKREGGSPFEVVLEADGSRRSLPADVVILAVPADRGAALVGDMDQELAAVMETIPFAAMAVAHMGFREDSLPAPLDGFGYLIPHREKRRILGTLWASSIFEERAPEGHVLLTTMVGGAKDPVTPMLDTGELVSVVREELKEIMGISEEPAFINVLRWDKAIPLYTPGHPGRVASLEERLKNHPGLFLTGNSYRGIGVNDCVSSGMKVAEEAAAHLKGLLA